VGMHTECQVAVVVDLVLGVTLASSESVSSPSHAFSIAPQQPEKTTSRDNSDTRVIYRLGKSDISLEASRRKDL
jgi:hypothetical protein